MDSLERRLRDVELKLDTQDNDKTVIQTIKQLDAYLAEYINKHANLLKLVNNINNSKINLRILAPAATSEREEDSQLPTEHKEQIILANYEEISSLIKQVTRIQTVPHNLEISPELMLQAPAKLKDYYRLQQLKLEYNQLLVRSITLLQNYLRLNENIDRFFKCVKFKISEP